MNALLAQLDDLKAQWLAAQPLPASKNEELWRKFRLEWNYNSNHIEGNTLTYGETELLLIVGQTKGDHTIREYDEMKAHDVAVKMIADWSKESRILREADIRDLNKIILKEPYWTEAITEQGQPTQVEIIPGDYKRYPNNVKSPTGESVLFASPTDTPAQMGDFVKWLHTELESPALHPIEFAAQLHHRFLRIHPFADGNGRVARLLANYVLMRAGFPPLIVKSRDKANYIAALRVADVGDSNQLTDYFARGMQWSLEMALRAAKGQSLNEPGDVEKEVAVFIKQRQGEKTEALTCSPDNLVLSLERGLRSLLRELKRKLATLEPLFERSEIKCSPYGKITPADWDLELGGVDVEGKVPDTFWVQYQYLAYQRECKASFDIKIQVNVSFERARYRVFAGMPELLVKRYGEHIASDEIQEFTDDALKAAFERIKREAGST